MASVNKWIGIGNLGRDPETRYTASGEAICNFSIACTETWKDKQTGERKEMTEWVRISAFGKLAEICSQYLKKGSQVYIEGRIRTRKWQGQDGQDRYTTEIEANEMQMLGRREGMGDSGPRDSNYSGGGRPAARPAAQNNTPASSGFNDVEDDIPF